MNRLDDVEARLRERPLKWLVTGAAGFIGSHLVDRLVSLQQDVVGLDNLSTGHLHNLEAHLGAEPVRSTGRFRFVEGDIRDLPVCRDACDGVDIVLHQAALGSVPRSVADPLATHASNLTGFLQVLLAARDAGVERFVYAASSSTYGDSAELPKVEGRIGRPLSPYAVTKLANELYAFVFNDPQTFQAVGLRYFNVFGARQDPDGPYAAVIPRWISRLLDGARAQIYGDGETSRDFTFVDNVTQANLLVATASSGVAGEVFNVACGERTTLNSLLAMLSGHLVRSFPGLEIAPPENMPYRTGDVRHSHASIDKLRSAVGYEPSHTVEEGIAASIEWYIEHLSPEIANAPGE